MPSFGIVGHGFVGRATARCFMEYGEVRIYDKVPKLRTHSVEETLECDFVFICLPTPDDCHTGIIENFFAQHVERGHKATFILKSTVPVGFTRKLAEKWLLGIAHVPEFLTARCALVDAQCPARVIIGFPGVAVKGVELLHRERFPGTPILVMHSDESEFVKLSCNSFFALKIWFFNALYEKCRDRSFDYLSIIEGILSDGRIAHAHTQVPGPDGEVGFGGACLPKDLTALAILLDSTILRDVLKDNSRMRGELPKVNLAESLAALPPDDIPAFPSLPSLSVADELRQLADRLDAR